MFLSGVVQRIANWWHGWPPALEDMAEIDDLPPEVAKIVDLVPTVVAELAPIEPAPIELGDEDAQSLIIAEEVISYDDAEIELLSWLSPKLRARTLVEMPAPAAFPDRAARALAKRTYEVDQLIALAHTDVATAAALLRAANSAFYRTFRPLDDIRDAIARLGTLLATQIVTGVAAQALFDVQTRAEQAVFPNVFRSLFSQSMTVALVSSRVAERMALPRAELAFSGGLLHDIGKVVALRTLSQMVMDGSAPTNISDNVSFRAVEDAHVEVGTALLTRWAMPEAHLALCAHHHDAEIGDGPTDGVLHVLRVVSGMNALRIDRVRHGTVVPEIHQSAKWLGLGFAHMDVLARELDETATHLSAVL